MTAEGHLLFSISCAIFAKNIELTPVLKQGDWWHIISASVLTCILPDVDHPRSLLGHRLRWISKPVSKIFKHRGFTHSPMLIVFAIFIFPYLTVYDSLIFQPDSIQGMILGYASHIIADMLTPSGIPLFWPYRWRLCLPILIQKKRKQSERILCVIFFILAVCMPEILTKDNVS